MMMMMMMKTTTMRSILIIVGRVSIIKIKRWMGDQEWENKEDRHSEDYEEGNISMKMRIKLNTYTEGIMKRRIMIIMRMMR